MSAQEDPAKLIRDTLVEGPGVVDRELVEACRGLIRLDEANKLVSVQLEGVTDKERIVLYCLGKKLMSYLTGSPESGEVSRKELSDHFGMDAKMVSAYISMILKDKARTMRRGKVGEYEAVLASMKPFLSRLREKLANKNV